MNSTEINVNGPSTVYNLSSSKFLDRFEPLDGSDKVVRAYVDRSDENSWSVDFYEVSRGTEIERELRGSFLHLIGKHNDSRARPSSVPILKFKVSENTEGKTTSLELLPSQGSELFPGLYMDFTTQFRSHLENEFPNKQI